MKSIFIDLWLAYNGRKKMSELTKEPRFIAALIFVIVPIPLIIVYFFETLVLNNGPEHDTMGYVVTAAAVTGLVLFGVSWKHRRGQLYLLQPCEHCGKQTYVPHWDRNAGCDHCGHFQRTIRPKIGAVTIFSVLILLIFLAAYARPRFLTSWAIRSGGEWELDPASPEIDWRTSRWFRSDRVDYYYWGRDENGDIGWVSRATHLTMEKPEDAERAQHDEDGG